MNNNICILRLFTGIKHTGTNCHPVHKQWRISFVFTNNIDKHQHTEYIKIMQSCSLKKVIYSFKFFVSSI